MNIIYIVALIVLFSIWLILYSISPNVAKKMDYMEEKLQNIVLAIGFIFILALLVGFTIWGDTTEGIIWIVLILGSLLVLKLASENVSFWKISGTEMETQGNRPDGGSFSLGYLLGIIFGMLAVLVSCRHCKDKTYKGIKIGFFAQLISIIIIYVLIKFIL